MPVAVTRTIASSGASSSGSGRSSTRTSPGAWKVTACTAGKLSASHAASIYPRAVSEGPTVPRLRRLLGSGAVDVGLLRRRRDAA